MKRTLIFTLLACGASLMLGAAAQAETAEPSASPAASPSASPAVCPAGGHHHNRKGGGVLQHLTYELGLSGTQEAAVASILEAAKPQMKAIREQAQAQRKTLVDSVASQITPLLTADQQTKFTAMVQKVENGPAAGGGKHRRHPGAGAGPAAQGDILQKLTTTLGLSADQQSQIKPILDAAHTQILAVRQDTTLTQEQKFAKIKETMEAAHSQIKGILTPAQQEQLATLRGKFHHQHGPEAQPSATPSVTGS